MNYFYKRIIKEFRVPPKEYAWERLIYHKGGFVIVLNVKEALATDSISNSIVTLQYRTH